jgi:V-type H+-transporting ATPase subunit a
MIHQLIETIEFILGTVSNTASYLRLWALSLAHSELGRVFFDNCISPGLKTGSVVSLYFGFFIFIGATFGVLMCMDLLECSLHTLRLHWVEFQNKFFKGQGVSFAPHRIEDVLIR